MAMHSPSLEIGQGDWALMSLGVSPSELERQGCGPLKFELESNQ
jgi:hypothetical protein